MTEQVFSKICKERVAAYANKSLYPHKPLTADDIFIVWQCKILQNNKALLATPLPDSMYYECTYNGDTQEMYLDAYRKLENVCFSVHTEDIVSMEDDD